MNIQDIQHFAFSPVGAIFLTLILFVVMGVSGAMASRGRGDVVAGILVFLASMLFVYGICYAIYTSPNMQ